MTHAPSIAARNRSRRGSVVVIVLWTVAVAALITSAIQLFGFRQGMLGREALARVQARWAARSGLEQTIAVMVDHTRNPNPDDAYAMIRDMELVRSRELLNAAYDIRHEKDRRAIAGPMDEHAKININQSSQTLRALLAELDPFELTTEAIDAIEDWVDEDDEPREQGAEADHYAYLSFPYEPRNAPFRTIAELDLVTGIWPEHLRGEDWDLDGRLDPNEDDGGQTWPTDDDGNGELDAGWSAWLTTWTVAGGATASGLPRINLRDTTPEEVVERIGITNEQATWLMNYGRTANSLGGLLNAQTGPGGQSQQGGDGSGSAGNRGQSRRATATPQGGQSGDGSQQGGSTSAAQPFADEQLRAIFAETGLSDPEERLPGRININTVSEDLLRRMVVLDDILVDELLYLRSSRPEGITSLVDLKQIPSLRRPEAAGILEQLANFFDTTSNVFTIACKGRSLATGLEVEIIAVVDRSTAPITILDYREQ